MTSTPYRNPWEQCLILAARRKVAPGEKIGIVLTDGSALKNETWQHANRAQKIAGLRDNVASAARLQDSLIDRAIVNLAKSLNCKILKRWQATGKTGAAVVYTGLVLQGLSSPQNAGAAAAVEVAWRQEGLQVPLDIVIDAQPLAQGLSSGACNPPSPWSWSSASN